MKYIKSDFYREVSPPDSLSSMSTGTPSGKSDNSEGSSGEGSQLPNGDTSRNIGRPSPDSPSLKSRNLDRSESYGRKPAEGFDGGYVHDSGSGSARVIPYDSGFVNNSSPLRKAGRPIRLDKAKIKAMVKDAIETLGGMISKSRYETLSETLKRTTMNGKISLGSYTVTHETTGHTSSVEISLGVEEKKGRAGLYTYKPEREQHLVDVYLEDKSIKLLTNSFFYDYSVKPAWTKRIFSTLIHEITHAVERIKYLKDRGTGSETDMSMIKTRKDQKNVKRKYYNHPAEVKAFLQQIAHEVEEYLIQTEGAVSREALHKGWRGAFGYHGSKTWKRVSNSLTPKNQKYIKKSVISYLMEIIESKDNNRTAKNVPLDEKLWAEVQALAKGESSKPVSRGKDSVNPVNDGKGFETFPSAYANGWALAQYKRLGGKWKKESKKAGLIKPPKHLVDKASEILRAGFASYWVEKQREMDEKPVSPLSLEHISNFEDLMGNLEDVYMSLRVGEATFDELDTALRDLKTKTQDLIGMGVPLMGGLHEHLGEMSPISVFEEPEGYEGDFDYIFSKKNRFLKRLKTTLDRNREASRPYISETSRRLYERESDKVKRFDGLSHERYLRTWDLQTEELGTIRLMVRKSDVKGTKGFYRYEDNLHKIAVLTDPKSTDLSDKELDNIKGYVRHELVHVMQKQMSLSFNVDQAGIPFQKYDETYRQRQMGARKEKDLKDQYARAGLDPRLIQIHALDDIEFYTRLLDEVVAFQNLNRNRSDLNQEAHDWVSKRIFFASLKRFKIKSWKKAVGIFVDAVNSNNLKYSSLRVGRNLDNESGVLLDEKLFYIDQASSRVAHIYLESVKRDDPKKKNTGKGGLGTWFSGHGGGDPDGRATWGDWVAITPVKHTITKEDGKKKTYEPGDIVGPCAVSSESDWKDVTSGGKKPLKCMPREKAWKMPKKDRAELAKKKRREEAKHRGQKPVNTPTFSDEAKEIKKKKASASRVAYRYLQSASQPAQDLGGVKTWVDKNRQDQVQNDTSSPDKSREDYEDGKPQRDRVLPLPSGHPEGRDEQRVGPGQINSPPDSSGQGGANRPKKDPAALSDHPNDKALHERPRSSGVPGDEYGNPYIDQSQSTGITRRVMASIDKISYVEEDEFYSEEEGFFWDIEDDLMVKNALTRYNFRPPRGDNRQRQQKGEAKRKSQKNKRKNRVQYRRNLIKQKRLYKRKKHNPTYKKYKKNYAKNTQRYKRRPGGGVSTSKQKSQRAEKRSK